jgi:cytochrome c oxidase subunit II
VWGLVIWAAIVYRRRKGQTGLPVQMRYNMPLEIFYTIVPLILVLGFFAFTAKDQAAIEKPFADPDATVHVYGKRWAWDFNYINKDNPEESVYYQGIQAQEEENANGAIDESQLPTLSTRRTCSRARPTGSTSSRRSSARTRASARSSAVSTTR